jgi:hypothetical protein
MLMEAARHRPPTFVPRPENDGRFPMRRPARQTLSAGARALGTTLERGRAALERDLGTALARTRATLDRDLLPTLERARAALDRDFVPAAVLPPIDHARTVLVDAWEGRRPLAELYWGWGVPGNMALAALFGFAFEAARRGRLSIAVPETVYAASLVWFGVVVRSVWRSSERHPRTEIGPWLARAGLLVGLVRMAIEGAAVLSLRRRLRLGVKPPATSEEWLWRAIQREAPKMAVAAAMIGGASLLGYVAVRALRRS